MVANFFLKKIMDIKLVLFLYLTQFFILNVISRTVVKNESELISANKNYTRRKRSGGFPKFPIVRSGEQDFLQCGNREVNHSLRRRPKIIGGDEPPYGSYPWQVEIALYDSERSSWHHHCGGAILAGGRLILTAAHCLQPPVKPDVLRVLAGDHRLGVRDAHEQVMRVERMAVHPDFRKVGPYSNDIALLKVSKSGKSSDHGFTFGSHVQPICLPEKGSGPPPGTWCAVTGWGAQKPDDIDSLSTVLRAIAVPILETSTCRRDDIYGGRQQQILDTMVCAGRLEGGVDACGGDSGGPLSCEWAGRFQLAGVVSWGDGCAKRNRPGVYTRVDAYIDWIRETAKEFNIQL